MISATIHHGTLPLLLSGPVRSRGERGALDSVTWEILTHAGMEEEDAAALGFTYDQQIESSTLHSIWIQSTDDELESDLTTRVTIRAIGLIKPGEKRRRKLACAGREISIGPFEKVIVSWNDEEKGRDPKDTGTTVINVERRTPKLKPDDTTDPAHRGEVDYEIIHTPSGDYERWNIKQAILVVRDSYYTTTRPSSTSIGTAQSPPNAPEPPANQFEDYDKPMRGNFPNGWVLDDRTADEIFVSATDPDTGLWAVEDVFGYYYPTSPD